MSYRVQKRPSTICLHKDDIGGQVTAVKQRLQNKYLVTQPPVQESLYTLWTWPECHSDVTIGLNNSLAALQFPAC